MNSLKISSVVGLGAAILGYGCIAHAAAQTYPSEPIRILVGFAAASATDTAARMLAQRLNKGLRQPVIVENRPGAGGAIAIEAVAKAPSDGYTLLTSAASITIQPAMRAKLPFDVSSDFFPVGYDRNGWYGLIGPAGLPQDVVNKLNAAIVKGVNTPEMKAAFFKQGLEPETNTPEQFAEVIRRELEQNAKLARSAGIARE